MDLFELVATLGLDTDPFTSALGGVEKIAMKALGELADLAIDFGKDVLKTGMGFDKQMSAVQAVLGREQGTLENMNRLRAFALEQAEDSIFTAEQTAQAYYYMGMAGWKTEEMIAGLPGIMDLAAASGEDLGMVSDVVTDSLTAFGLAAGDASWYADILAQTATNSNTDVRRMGETFKYVAPIAGALGIAVDDVALAIGLMANAGIKGSQAGTSLRQILTRIATNAGETKKDLGALTIVQDKLGVTVWDSAGEMRDFSNIIDECRVAWKNLTPEMQTYYAKQIGSQRGMPAWLAMMNAAEEDLDQLKEAYMNAGGAAEYMADIKLDNLWGDIARFNSAYDTMKIALFDDVKGPLRDVVQYGTDAIKSIHSAIDEGGLVGGLHQFGVEIHNFGVEYKDEISELGSAISEVLSIVLTELTPVFTESAVTLGASFAKGFGSGVLEFLPPGILSMLGFDLSGQNTPNPDDFGKITYGISNERAYQDALNFLDAYDIKAEELRDLVNNAGNNTSIEIGGEMVNTDWAREMLEALEAVGPEAGASIASDLESEIATGSGNAALTLLQALFQVGPEAGASVANDVQAQLNSRSYSIDVIANVVPSGGGGGGGWKMERYAKSMSGGTILQGATVFGMNRDGQPLVGGEAGPEAIVGTGSLGRMIQSSVRASMSELIDRLDEVAGKVSTYSPRIYLYPDTLVGGIAPNMNGELSDIADWKGYGRV